MWARFRPAALTVPAPRPSAARRCEDLHLSQQRRSGAKSGRGQGAWPVAPSMPVRGGLWRGLRPQTCSGGSLPSSLRSPRLGSVVCHSRSLRSMCRETEDGCPVRARAARPTHPPFQSQERRPVPERGAGAAVPPSFVAELGRGARAPPAGSRPGLARAAWPCRTCDGGSEVDGKAATAAPSRSFRNSGPQVCGPDPLSLIACRPALTRGQAV